MEISGRIIAALPLRSGTSKATGNTWEVQEYVIETHDQYPKKCVFEVFGSDKIKQFALQQGEEVTVSFDIDARQWNDRWFNSIRAWKVDRAGAGQPAQPQTSGAPIPPPFAPTDAPVFNPSDVKDDLPF
ncbi:MAG: DUF3127 domain-containing protein [Prevotellaceae bacterium]|jgi:hypothetical protein|nr:DUF3127 domain-containing protein [Prevotellaceae bacterium]